MIDYLIVGSGLAGIAFAETALRSRKSILVFDADLFRSSKVAGGLYNPVVLKRFTPLASAQEHLNELQDFYVALEGKLNCQLNFNVPVLRKFASVEEQNNWFLAADKTGMAPFLSTDLVFKTYSGIDSPFGYGKVNQTGYVDTPLQVDKYKTWLSEHDLVRNETFNYDLLRSHADHIEYQDIQARHIIFAEGFGMHANPFFCDLPLNGAKGELLVIKAPDLSLDVILNASAFILPIGDGFFKIGATYNWSDKTETPTEEAKAELIERLKEIITCEFEIVDQYAGVRPTVKDRKPLIGTHRDYPRVHILNGMGTRGVMLAPSMAKTLFNHIESGTVLPKDIDIRRFEKKLG